MSKQQMALATIKPSRKGSRAYAIGVRREAGGVRFCFADKEKDLHAFCSGVAMDNDALDTNIHTYCWMTAPAARVLIKMLQAVL